MNREQMIASLREALDRNGATYREAIERCRNVPQEFADRLRDQFLGERVREVLELQDEFQGGGFLLARVVGYVGLQTSVASELLVTRAQQLDDPVAAVDWMESILRTKEAKGLWIMPLWGVAVEQKVALTNEVQLWPFDQLPPSAQERGLGAYQRLRSTLGATWYSPKVALICEVLVKPLLFDLRHGRPPDRSEGDVGELFDEIRTCLTAVGPCAPFAVTRWFQFADEAVEAAVHRGSATYLKHMEIAPLGLPLPTAVDAVAAEAAVKSYLQLAGPDRIRMRTALQRLHQASFRRDPGDAAVELTVALEAVLGSGRGSNKYSIGLRAGLLVEHEIEKRLQARSAIGAVYDLRNTRLHEGTTPNEVNVAGRGKVKAKEALREGVTICAAIIFRLLTSGGTPDWSTFELSGGQTTPAHD